jgi:hypothetical protein
MLVENGGRFKVSISSNILNADQTGVKLVPSGNDRTYNVKGVKIYLSLVVKRSKHLLLVLEVQQMEQFSLFSPSGKERLLVHYQKLGISFNTYAFAMV